MFSTCHRPLCRKLLRAVCADEKLSTVSVRLHFPPETPGFSSGTQMLEYRDASRSRPAILICSSLSFVGSSARIGRPSRQASSARSSGSVHPRPAGVWPIRARSRDAAAERKARAVKSERSEGSKSTPLSRPASTGRGRRDRDSGFPGTRSQGRLLAGFTLVFTFETRPSVEIISTSSGRCRPPISTTPRSAIFSAAFTRRSFRERRIATPGRRHRIDAEIHKSKSRLPRLPDLGAARGHLAFF